MCELQVILNKTHYHEGRIGFWLWLGPLTGAKVSWGGWYWHGPTCRPPFGTCRG